MFVSVFQHSVIPFWFIILNISLQLMPEIHFDIFNVTRRHQIVVSVVYIPPAERWLKKKECCSDFYTVFNLVPN